MQLNSHLKNILEEVSFIDRYKKLSNSHRGDNSLENYSVDEVLKIFKDLGYDVKYFKKDNFFKILNKEGEYELHLNISLKYGVVEFVLAVANKSTGLVEGGPFGFILQLMGVEEKVFKPSFQNYEELKEILERGLEIFEDIKIKVLGKVS